ncbi:hypothetical protein FQ185_17205 [Pseudomonas sp. ANT_H12B]|nr:hypothetical protein FQ185_17205 [Pseudomonas sp. ANT_H12B]
MGASLLAIAIYHSASMSTDTPLSRAGSLPQGLRRFRFCHSLPTAPAARAFLWRSTTQSTSC